jgi:ankyrin repeat protein
MEQTIIEIILNENNHDGIYLYRNLVNDISNNNNDIIYNAIIECIQNPDCNVNYQNLEGINLLMICSAYCINDKIINIMMNLLRRNDIDVNLQNRHGQTALIFACALHHAQSSIQQHEVATMLLLGHGDCNVNHISPNNNETILSTSFRYFPGGFGSKNNRITDILLDHPDIGQTVNVRDNLSRHTILDQLCSSDDNTYYLMEKLLRLQNININININDGGGYCNDTPLMTLIKFDYRISDINIRGFPIKKATLLLTHPNFDPNIQNDDGNTILMIICNYSCGKRYESIFNTLLERPDLDFNIKNNNNDDVIAISEAAGNSEYSKKIKDRIGYRIWCRRKSSIIFRKTKRLSLGLGM